MNGNLLPCPHCGGTNVAAVSAADDYGTFDWKVYCEDCDAFHETEEQAIAAWNKRAVTEEIEELKRQLNVLQGAVLYERRRAHDAERRIGVVSSD